MSNKGSWLICGIILIVSFFLSSFLSPVVFLGVAFFAFWVGWGEMKKNESKPVGNYSQPPIQSAATARVELPERKMPDDIPANLKCPSCGATIKPNDTRCTYCGSTLKPLVELPEPANLAALEIGKSVRLVHPQKGELVYSVRGRLLHTELWQASSGRDVPWTPTGNYYAGFSLQPEAYLLNWQDRFYILEERKNLTDMDINSSFMPYARQFGQSNQTARVEFQYDGVRWQMVDIGRFAIEFAGGQGLHLSKGAIGRFIHSVSGSQALIVEDFQSGGSGQDSAWKGFQVKETEITF